MDNHSIMMESFSDGSQGPEDPRMTGKRSEAFNLLGNRTNTPTGFMAIGVHSNNIVSKSAL